MAASLKPCGSCSRHVRTYERACPFCGEPLALTEPVAELRLLSRLDRSTMVALGAVLSAAGIVLGCREAAPVAIYGAPASPEQMQPAPSAEPPPAAPNPAESTVVAPEPPPSASPSSPPPSDVTLAPAASSASTHATKPKPPPAPQPFAPSAAYGAPPRRGPPDGLSPIAPGKPDSRR